MGVVSKVVRPQESNEKYMLRLFPTYECLLKASEQCNWVAILVTIIVDYWLLKLILSSLVGILIHLVVSLC